MIVGPEGEGRLVVDAAPRGSNAGRDAGLVQVVEDQLDHGRVGHEHRPDHGHVALGTGQRVDADAPIEPIACGLKEWFEDDSRPILEIAPQEGGRDHVPERSGS